MGYLFPSSCGRKYSPWKIQQMSTMSFFYYFKKKNPMLMLCTGITNEATNRTIMSHVFFYYSFKCIMVKISLRLFTETEFFGEKLLSKDTSYFCLFFPSYWQDAMAAQEVKEIGRWIGLSYSVIFPVARTTCFINLSWQGKGQVLQGWKKIIVIIFKLVIINMHFIWLGSMV